MFWEREYCQLTLDSKSCNLAQPLADYLVAQVQALVADPRFTGCCHGLSLVAAFPAEAALLFTVLIADLLDRGDRRTGRFAGRGQHCVHAVDAAVADEDIRPGN